MKTQIKTFAIAAFAAFGMAAASVPAMADSRDWRSDRQDYREDRIDHRLNELDRQIDRGARYGNLSRREEGRLRAELRHIERQASYFERTGRGLDRRELQILTQRTHSLSRDIAYNTRDRGGRW